MNNYKYFADQYEGNGDPDLAAYAHAGHCLYAHKATEGALHIDRRHAARAMWAHESGLTVMHYHYCRPDEHYPRGERALFWSQVEPVFKSGDILALDFERGAVNDRGLTDTTYIERFWNDLHGTTGHSAVVYGSTSFLEDNARIGWLRWRRRWQAQYGSEPGRAPWGTAKWAWQLTDGQSGPLPHALTGIGRCDVSLLNPWTALALRARTARRRRTVKK